MNTLRDRMAAAGATFVPAGDKLKVRALRPLPPDLVTDLKAVRGDLLDVYRERAAIRIHDAGMDEADAEREAARDVMEILK